MKSYKFLAVLIIFTLIFSSISTVSAEGSVSAELSIDKIGHIFTDKAICVTSIITNGADVAKRVEYTFEVTDDSGKTVYSQSDTLELAIDGNANLTFDFSVPKYDFYGVYIEVNDGDEVLASATSRFSAVHAGNTLNKKSGLNSHYHVGRGLDEINELQKLFASTGFGQVREGVTWEQYESEEGVYGLKDRHKTILNEFKNNAQNNLLILGHENTARNIGFPKTQDEITAWKTYVEKLVKEAESYGIKDFELWNEVNMMWSDGSVTAAQYVNLMKETYPIVKAISGSRLFAFSLAGEEYTPSWSDFMDECLAIDGCIDSFDGISYHPYYNAYMPEDKFAESFAEINDTVEKWNLHDKAQVISEAGYTYSDETEYELEKQAKYTVRQALMAYDAAEYTDWFMNVEKIDQTDKPAQVHFGWLRGWENQEINYEAKPVFAAMANFNAVLANAESTGNLSLPDKDRYLYKFRKDGNDIYAVWKSQGSEQITLALGCSKAEIYDFYGNMTPVTTDNGNITLAINDYPQYIVGDFSEGIFIDDNIVTINGQTDEPCQRISISVLRPEGDTWEKTGEYVYIDEAVSDSDGKFSFVFKDSKYNRGVYTIRLRIGNTVSSAAYEYDVCIPRVTLTDTATGNVIGELSDITGTGIDTTLEVVNILDNTLSGKIICAQYSEGVLISAQTMPVEVDAADTVKEYNFAYHTDKNIDTVKVFLWNTDNCTPMIKNIVVE